MSEVPSASELVLYQTEDGDTRIHCRFEHGTLWLTQTQMAELFQSTIANISQHLKSIYAEAELDPEATIKSHLTVRSEGARPVSRPVRHYHLSVILAVGFRVRSARGTQFRQWATARLEEYLVKGFAMDDERLKNPPGPGHVDYFDELLERIRDIRASERRFYQKVLDIYATSVDYRADDEVSQRFFATVQNKMHFASQHLPSGSGLSQSVFVRKYDVAGEDVWAYDQPFVEGEGAAAFRVALDATEHAIIVGHRLQPDGHYDAWVAKLTP